MTREEASSFSGEGGGNARRSRRDDRIFGIRVTPGRRLVFFLGVDAFLVLASLLGAFLLRLGGTIPTIYWPAIALLGGFAIVATLGNLLLSGIYNVSWAHVGLRDLGWVAYSVGFATLVLGAITLIWHGQTRFVSYPRSIVLIQAPLAFLAISGFRLSKRAYKRFDLRQRHDETGGAPTLLIGAGDAGEQVLDSIINTSARADHDVVGFLDDDPLAHGTEIHGVPVLGHSDDLEDIVRRHDVETVIVCITGATSDMLRDVTTRARASGATDIRTVPTGSQLLDGSVSLQRTRDVSLEDLLGREPADIDDEGVGELLEGKRVLVTGGAGTIGSELCRQIARFHPERIVALDVDESRLHELRREVEEAHGHIPIVESLVDIREEERVREVFEQHSPDVVFHAAAYKHVPMLEEHPVAALSVNVLGTQNVLEAADEMGTERFVLVSTDKAVQPSNVMGSTKRVAEALTFESDQAENGLTCSAVRFGNVLGSRGSVIEIFRRQLEDGGPLTVTHPEVERYFMMTSEAVSLVLQAAALGEGGDLFVLDMGEPVKILDVAEQLVRLSGLEPDVDVPIVFTGLRPGEKLSETLRYPDEDPTSTEHPRIKRLEARPEVPVEATLKRARHAVEGRDNAAARGLLEERFETLAEHENASLD